VCFQRLATDPHVRRYLMDGEIMEIGWCEAVIRDSDALFASEGIGLWLVSDAVAPEIPIGFCGFREFPELMPGSQLLYALLERATGRGLAR